MKPITRRLSLRDGLKPIEEAGTVTKEVLYTLRLWRDGPSEDWRASLKEMKSQEARYFRSLEALASYLAARKLRTGKPEEKEKEGGS